MKSVKINKIFHKYPVLIGLILIAILIGGLVIYKYWMERQVGESTIIPEDLAREQTIEQFQDPEDLLRYIMSALQKKDLDLFLRACAVDERLLANPFYETINKSEMFGYDMGLPPSADYEEYRALSSIELAKYYTDKFEEFQKYFADLSVSEISSVGILHPEEQMSSDILYESSKICGSWGADAAVKMAVLIKSQDKEFMVTFTVTKYYGYWKVFDFGSVFPEDGTNSFIEEITKKEFDSITEQKDILGYLEELSKKLNTEETTEEQAEKEEIKDPEKEILPPNYFIVGSSFGKDEKDTIQKFLLALQKKDVTKALSYCNIDAQAEDLNSVNAEVIQLQERFAKQLTYLYYGLLGEEYSPESRKLNELEKTAEDILEELNPEMIPYMDVKDMIEVKGNLPDNEAQYVVFYAFNGKCYVSGYTLVWQDEGWQIASLSLKDGNLKDGEVKEISWKKYNQLMGNE